MPRFFGYFFDEIERMEREMEEVAERMLRAASPGFAWEMPSQRWMPAVDVCETDDEFFITIELPGLEKDDFELFYQNDALWVRGERRKPNPTGSYVMLEISYGPFERRIPLPSPIDPDKIDATYRAGVLEIRAAKVKAQPKEVQVKIELR